MTTDQTLNEVIFPVWAECFPGIFSMHNAQPETKLFCLSNNTFIFCMHIFQIFFFFIRIRDESLKNLGSIAQ